MLYIFLYIYRVPIYHVISIPTDNPDRNPSAPANAADTCGPETEDYG